MGMGVSVVTIGDGHSNKTSENDEGLKGKKINFGLICFLFNRKDSLFGKMGTIF